MFIDLTTISVFIFAALMIAIIPGPDMVFILKNAVSKGMKFGFVSVLGTQTGVLIHIFLAAFGLSAIIGSSPIAFNIIKYIGAVYLIFLGVEAFLNKSEVANVTTNENVNLKGVFLRGFLINAFNPKAILFFVAFLPQFIDTKQENATMQMIFLGVLLLAITLPINSLFSLFGDYLNSFINNERSLLRLNKFLVCPLFLLLGILTFFANPAS